MNREIDDLRSRLAAFIHAHWRLFLIQGLFMMGLGFIAIVLPQISTLAVEIFVGWLFFIGGILRLLAVLHARNAPGFWWSLITAALACVLGAILITHVQQGVLSLTLALAIMFAVEGIGGILISLDYRPHVPNWGWTLLSGLVDLVLVYLIWQGWPGTAAWAIGLLVGINMLFVGLALVMTAISARTMNND